jgi:hypothetical protein
MKGSNLQGFSSLKAQKGRDISAQGNALGILKIIHFSPERAIQKFDLFELCHALTGL